MAIKEVLSAPRSPWQRAYVERVIGTIRRECLDHVIVFGEAALYQHVKRFMHYYHQSRTHLRWRRTRPNRGLCIRRYSDPSLPYRKWAAFTTGTDGGPPDHSERTILSTEADARTRTCRTIETASDCQRQGSGR